MLEAIKHKQQAKERGKLPKASEETRPKNTCTQTTKIVMCSYELKISKQHVKSTQQKQQSKALHIQCPNNRHDRK